MSSDDCSREIKSIVVYGSQARGDIDSSSDFDICVFTNRKTIVELGQLVSFLNTPQQDRCSITTYCESDLIAMLEYGSLFLWHIKLEGRILYGDEYLNSYIEKLRPFERHLSEIKYYSEIFSDLTATFNRQYIINEFDLALLFTIARNTCMILAHKAGHFAFGRCSSYFTAVRAFHDIPIDEETYLKLSHWKMVYERGFGRKIQLPSGVDMEQTVTVIQSLLDYAHAHVR